MGAEKEKKVPLIIYSMKGKEEGREN